MKNKSIFFVCLLFVSVAYAQDTVQDGDPWYSFSPHAPFSYENVAIGTGNWAISNWIKQCCVKDSSIVVYGVAITAKAFPLNIETVYPPTMLLYRHVAAGTPPSIAFVDSANVYDNMYKSCLFNYVVDDNSFNIAGSYVRPCFEFYFDTPFSVDASDTFYISHYWPMDRYQIWCNWWNYEQNSNPDLLYVVCVASSSSTQAAQETWWQSYAFDTITNHNAQASGRWGGIFPIVKLRCVSPRLWLTEQDGRTATVSWRQNDTPEQYQLTIGSIGSVPDSGTSVYTTDTSYTFTDLEPDTRYSVWVRKACRYTTAGYDTLVWSEWSTPVGFLSLNVNEVEADGVRLLGQNGHILVQGAEGKEVRVYDMLGREVSGKRKVESENCVFAVPAAGVYMVRIDNLPARKVVVVR